MAISVVILTFNSAATIGATLDSAGRVSDDVHVVDSFSTDATLDIVRERGARIVQHEFENYGAQRNWAIDTLPLRHDWQLHLDADERLTEDLVAELVGLKDRFPADVDGYMIARLVHFLGRPLRHGGMFPIWHLRLFRTGRGRCETRSYDQHFLCEGPVRRLRHPFVDDIRMDLTEWVARHNRWASLQAQDLARRAEADTASVPPRLFGTPIERRRAYRRFFNRAPILVRPFLLFLHRYVLLLGFLDGRPGLIFHGLQTFWFRFLVDAKLYEMRRQDGAGED